MKIVFAEIIKICKELLLNTRDFWSSKKDQLDTQFKLLSGFFLPLLSFAALMVLLGELFRSNHFYFGFAILKSLKVIVLFVLQYYVTVFFVRELMKTFGSEKNTKAAQNLVIYSLTPLLLVTMVTGIFPFLYVLDILGLYGFYIFWVGVPEILKFPENKRTRYTMLVLLICLFTFSFMSIFLNELIKVYY